VTKVISKWRIYKILNMKLKTNSMKGHNNILYKTYLQIRNQSDST